MAFDLTQVLSQAQDVSSKELSGGGKNYPKLVYPGSTGILKIKLLYNPKSNLVSRAIQRHKIENSQHVCLRNYGGECPICKTLESIKNATNVDLWELKSKTRGISYAQYVGSEGYSWGENEEPQVGELILFMYPWQVYQDINRIISNAGVNAVELIAKNEGKVLNITHSKSNNRHEYKTEVDAFAPAFKSCKDDAEFEAYLNDLPDLNETIVPRELSQDTMKDAQDVAESLSREYLRGVQQGMSGGFTNNVLSGNNQIIEVNGQQYAQVNGQLIPVASAPTPVQSVPPVASNTQMNPAVPPVAANTAPIQSAVPPTPTTPPVAPPTTPNPSAPAMPECFGKHKDGDPQCMVCIYELNCIPATK